MGSCFGDFCLCGRSSRYLRLLSWHKNQEISRVPNVSLLSLSMVTGRRVTSVWWYFLLLAFNFFLAKWIWFILNMLNTFDSIDTLIISYNINVVLVWAKENTRPPVCSDAEAVTPAWPVWFWYHPAAMRWAEMPISEWSEWIMIGASLNRSVSAWSWSEVAWLCCFDGQCCFGEENWWLVP